MITLDTYPTGSAPNPDTAKEKNEYHNNLRRMRKSR
jgi:hypothetical protein